MSRISFHEDLQLEYEPLGEEHIRLIQDKHTNWDEFDVVGFVREIEQHALQQAIKAIGRPVGWKDEHGCLHSETIVKALSVRVVDMDAVYAVKQAKPLMLDSLLDDDDADFYQTDEAASQEAWIQADREPNEAANPGSDLY